MKRCLLVVVSMTLSGTAIAAAQVHPGQHDRTRPHGPGHVRPDSATHAAVHGLLNGAWQGTFHRLNEGTHELFMRVAHDSAHGVSLALKAARLNVGLARELTLTKGVVQWTQDVGGVACKASARIDTTAKTTRTVNGKLACPTEEIAFTLRKQAQ